MKERSVVGFGFICLLIMGSSMRCSSSEHALNMEKYITKMYFEKHDTLVDSMFNHFIENANSREILQEKINTLPTLCALQRTLIGEGSHRRVLSSVRLKTEPESQSKWIKQSCVIVFIERLPSGIFADPFELQHLVQRGVFSDAAVFGDTNLELPSFQSNRSIVEIHINVAFNVSSANKEDLETNLEIPLHARYQPLGLGFSRIRFGLPDLFICCTAEGNAQSRSCFATPTNNSVDSNPSPFVWDIPCGIKHHAGVVSAVTFISAILAALLIIFASVRSSNSIKSKPL